MLNDRFGSSAKGVEDSGKSETENRNVASRPTLRIGHFETDEPFLARFHSNLRDFLASRPLRNPLTRHAGQSASPTGIWPNDVLQKDSQFARVEALSITIHMTILALLVLPLLPRIITPATTKSPYAIVPTADIAAFLSHLKPATTATTVMKKPGGGGGGGDHDPLPEGTGAIALFNHIQLAPPSVKTPLNPEYPVQPTILGPEELKLLGPEMNHWGNPVSPVINDSNGPGSDHGIGTGKGHGVGPGDGDGFGRGHESGIGGDFPVSGANGYREVACLYCPVAQFSDEAVKAKFQGTVLLSLVVTADGRATDVRVVRGLGMGLDEKAQDAVRKWRFQPSVGPDGKTAAVRAVVEVVFHLY